MEDKSKDTLFHPGLLSFAAALGGAVIGFVNTYDYLESPNTYSAVVAVGALTFLGAGSYSLTTPREK